MLLYFISFFFFFQAEDGIRDSSVTGVQTCALPISFRSCVVHGVVLDDEGQKLSKRSKNYTDPLDAFDRIGSDAVRWFLMSSPILRGADQVVTEKGIAAVIRRVINPLCTAWHLFALDAN